MGISRRGGTISAQPMIPASTRVLPGRKLTDQTDTVRKLADQDASWIPGGRLSAKQGRQGTCGEVNLGCTRLTKILKPLVQCHWFVYHIFVQ
jgi:hypothetical protein